MEDERKTKKQLIEELNKLRLERIEQARMASEKFTKAFLQNSIPMGITTLKDGRFIEISNSFLNIIGLTRDEVIGFTSTELGLITQQQRSSFFHELQKKGRIDNFEMEVRIKGGELRHGLFNAVMMNLQEEKCLLTAVTDITEKKLVIELLQKSEDKFNKAFHSSPILTAISTIEDGRFLDVNDIFLHTLSLDRDEVVGKTSLELGLFANSSTRQAITQITAENGYAKNIELQMVTKYGQIMDGLFSAEPIVFNDLKCWLTVMVDITDQKRAEAELRDSEEKYRLLFNSSGDAIFIHDDEERILAVNQQACEKFGYTHAELISMKVSQMDWPAELQNIPERIDRVIKQGSLLFEIVHKRKNGEPIQHEVNSQRIIWDDKPAVMSICRDISERKLAEKKLLDSEEKFRLLFNSGKDYMAVHLTGKDGQPGNFIQVNDAACEILGYTSEEMLQLSPRDVDSAKKSGLMPALIEKLIKNKHILFETEMIAKNGETIPMEVSLTLFQLQENQATICVARDLTERNRTSEKISKSNMLLNAIIENIPSTIFLKDAKDLRFLLFNKAAEDLAGYSSADVLGKSDYDFLSKEQADFFTDKDRDVLRGTKVVDIPEEPLQTRNKGQRILHTKKVPIFSTKGEPEYLLGISEDITDRKLAEEALVKSEEKYRNLSISSLDAIITEDLDGIITFANPAAQNLAGGLNLVGMSVKDFIPPELISKYNEMMEARRHGYLENISYEWSMILPKDGSIVVFDIRSSIIINKSNPSEILIVARDITERKRAEEELANSADKYRRIAENMIDSTFLLDRNGVFQYATNHKDKLGYELEDLIGITGMSITHPDELERIQRIYEGGVDGVWQEITYETRIRHKDGHYVPMEIRGRTFADHSGKISGAVFSGREIIQNQQKKQKTPSAKKSLVAVPELSAREKEILNWVVRGKSTWDIAKIIDIGEATVKYHIDKVMKKLSAVNRTHAAAIALRNKMLN